MPLPRSFLLSVRRGSRCLTISSSAKDRKKSSPSFEFLVARPPKVARILQSQMTRLRPKLASSCQNNVPLPVEPAKRIKLAVQGVSKLAQERASKRSVGWAAEKASEWLTIQQDGPSLQKASSLVSSIESSRFPLVSAEALDPSPIRNSPRSILMSKPFPLRYDKTFLVSGSWWQSVGSPDRSRQLLVGLPAQEYAKYAADCQM